MVHDLRCKTEAIWPFNLAHKLNRTENVLKGNEMTETVIEVRLCKTRKNPEIDGSEREREVRDQKN